MLTHLNEPVAPQATEPEFSERQQAVLNAVLQLMVEEGDALTMNAVAARASCSKETLYKWFDDRDGLLAATVQYQASKVRVDLPETKTPDREQLAASLEQFAINWLTVLTGDTSVALNGTAISHAAASKSDLGQFVLNNGPFAMARRIRPLLELGRELEILAFDDVDECFRTFFGLVVRDIQIRALLGDNREALAEDIKPTTQRAVRHFLTIYGTPEKGSQRIEQE